MRLSNLIRALLDLYQDFEVQLQEFNEQRKAWGLEPMEPNLQNFVEYLVIVEKKINGPSLRDHSNRQFND